MVIDEAAALTVAALGPVGREDASEAFFNSPTLPIFPSDVKPRRDTMAEVVETMLKPHVKNETLTADSLRLAASDGCSAGNAPEPLAVSRKPMASTALVYESYGLTE